MLWLLSLYLHFLSQKAPLLTSLPFFTCNYMLSMQHPFAATTDTGRRRDLLLLQRIDIGDGHAVRPIRRQLLHHPDRRRLIRPGRFGRLDRLDHLGRLGRFGRFGRFDQRPETVPSRYHEPDHDHREHRYKNSQYSFYHISAL